MVVWLLVTRAAGTTPERGHTCAQPALWLVLLEEVDILPALKQLLLLCLSEVTLREKFLEELRGYWSSIMVLTLLLVRLAKFVQLGAAANTSIDASFRERAVLVTALGGWVFINVLHVICLARQIPATEKLV
jgi:hypothetical protein